MTTTRASSLPAAGMLAVVLLLAAVRAQREPEPQAPPRPAAEQQTTHVFTNLTLVDGTGRAPQPGTTIVFRGEVIQYVGTDLPAGLTESASVTDLSGRHCVPGLIDVHTHLATSPSQPGYHEEVRRILRDLLGRGITDVRDMGGDGRVMAFLARQTYLGELPGPDIHFAAILAGPRFFADPRAVSSARGAEVGGVPWAHIVRADTDLDALMLRVVGCGATGVKLYAGLDPELTAAIAEAARVRGLQVWSHWVIEPRRTSARATVDAGVGVVSHAYMLMHDVSPAQRASSAAVLDAAGGPGLLAAMAERGTILDATLVAAGGLPERAGWVRAGVCAADVARAARAAGVMVATGSDHPGNGRLPGIHVEFALLVEDAGFSPGEVIEAATRIGARAIGIHERRGTLEVGKQATMLILASDPTASVAALAEPEYVVKRGVIYSGQNLRDASVPVEVLDRLAPK